MKVFKFGGASVKDAGAVKNLAHIVKKEIEHKLVIVVSAMGKTTSALEQVVKAHLEKSGEAQFLVESIKSYHFQIAEELFPDKSNPVFDELSTHFAELFWAIEEEQVRAYDYEYDQIVSIGELLSTRIVAAYLNEVGITTNWIDARDMLLTDNRYREAGINMHVSEEQSKAIIEDSLEDSPVVLTQGFIGGTDDNFTTTLGREGSDYTAALLAYFLDAECVVVWKDVPGVMNADPRLFRDAHLIPRLSYYDAIEMTYYGATVIHPKTIRPLQNKNIPLYVKSFLSPDDEGTIIHSDFYDLPGAACIIKSNQVLISIIPRDFSFIIEENLRDIFDELTKWRLQVNVMQNAALSFSLCLTADNQRFEGFIQAMEERYLIRYNKECTLINIRHYTEDLINSLSGNQTILLEQRTRQNIQMVLEGQFQSSGQMLK